MKNLSVLRAAVVAALFLPTVCAAATVPRTFTVRADRIAVDNVTKSAVLTGHVEAVSEPVHLLSELATRSADGVMHLHEPTSITTCTNHPGICHWAIKGDVEYKNGKYIRGKNSWLEFCELPIFWLPFFYYPLEGECALRVMPGYLDRWGAYLLTKYVYEIAGDRTHQDNTYWLHGNTRFDLRYENGIALGQTLYWNLGDFGRGKFKVYYAWDEKADDEYDSSNYVYDRRWDQMSSLVNRDRYAIELTHRWEITERDSLRVQGSLFSDPHFGGDFFRDGLFTIKNEWVEADSSEVAWEHNENAFALGMSVSGPLEKFRTATARLPEIYLDVQPQPVFSLPVNFESENRIGYLTRQAADYGGDPLSNPYSRMPGVWADYQAFRFDTYDRFTVPFKTFGDVLSIVPRIGYHGTGWSETGESGLSGWEEAVDAGAAFRSIVEGGVTFAARGRKWLNESWRHMSEPYFDILAQKAWIAGLSGDARPYLFDSIDGSRMWEEQFTGRSRELPYTYCGVTPGWRNAFDKADENGRLRTIFEFDVYSAIQFNRADFIGTSDAHKLAEADSPNYGKNGCYLAPGFRTRWTPAEDISLLARLEYDLDNNTVAVGDVAWNHRVSKDFSYYVDYTLREYRYWDFSSTPYDSTRMRDEQFNIPHYHYIKVGFTQQPLSWFAWSPFVRWDVKDNELDAVGGWIDYLTDCLGFRLLVEYENEYTRIDGYRRGEEFNVGFYIYLRALGPENANLFD